MIKSKQLYQHIKSQAKYEICSIGTYFSDQSGTRHTEKVVTYRDTSSGEHYTRPISEFIPEKYTLLRDVE